MYFFSGSEVCLKVMPAWALMSANCGIGRPVHFLVFAPGGGGGGSGCPLCPWLTALPRVTNRIASNRPIGLHVFVCLLEQKTTDTLLILLPMTIAIKPHYIDNSNSHPYSASHLPTAISGSFRLKGSSNRPICTIERSLGGQMRNASTRVPGAIGRAVALTRSAPVAAS